MTVAHSQKEGRNLIQDFK